MFRAIPGGRATAFARMRRRDPRRARADRSQVPVKANGRPLRQRRRIGPRFEGSPREGSQGTPSNGAAATTRLFRAGCARLTCATAGYFISLLPGPTDRHGLPECVRLWKDRIEETDPEKTFAVGLLYGPTAAERPLWFARGFCRAQLRRGPDLHRSHPRPDRGRGCSKPAPPPARAGRRSGACRRAQGDPRRTAWAIPENLLILDQFEQWLHGRPIDGSADFRRPCGTATGSVVQCVLMVRDDFWLAVSRFMRALEIPLVEGGNAALVDLFDLCATPQGAARIRSCVRPAAARPLGPVGRRERLSR